MGQIKTADEISGKGYVNAVVDKNIKVPGRAHEPWEPRDARYGRGGAARLRVSHHERPGRHAL